MDKKFCFGTLAAGKRYRLHARQLAQDIKAFVPDTTFIVLTDQPSDFADFSHVLAVKHRLTSVQGYHDKRHVIATAFSSFDTCLFLDSDVRILGPVENQMEFPPGLTGRFGCSILKHNKLESKERPALPLIHNVADSLDLSLEDVVWMHEFMFAVSKQDGVEKEFLRLWHLIALYFQINGIYNGEGNVMGLAAAASGFNAGFRRVDPFPFFKDCIEQEMIKNQQPNLQDKTEFFQAHKDVEFPSVRIADKILKRLNKKSGFLYRLAKVKITAIANPEFRRFRTMLKT
ncbi:MAG: hypothetical protein ACFBSC_08365 [Microcoleaceae cyanobacterium]